MVRSTVCGCVSLDTWRANAHASSCVSRGRFHLLELARTLKSAHQRAMRYLCPAWHYAQPGKASYEPNTIASVPSSLLLLGWSLLINHRRGCLTLDVRPGGAASTLPWLVIVAFPTQSDPCAKANVDCSDASVPLAL